MKRQTPADTTKTTLIQARGVYARVPGNPPMRINNDDTIRNPVGNGFWAVHKLFGEVLCITMGPNKGMWSKVSDY